MTTIIAASVIASFIIAAAIGPALIRYLHNMNFGQKILSYVPEHAGKQNTPTMGGFMFIISITLVTILSNVILVRSISIQSFTVLLLSLCYGLIGFIDDRTKIRKAENEGLTSKQKFALQLVLALVFLSVLHMGGYLLPSLYIPFAGVSLNIPWLVYIVIAAFIMVGCNNAVNLTDGLDGLAAGVTLPVAVYFIVIGVISNNTPVVVFASALAGGLAAFLIFNFNPAKVFMGDTGSLTIGFVLSILAIRFSMSDVTVLHRVPDAIVIAFSVLITPVFDVVRVILHRARFHKNIFSPDKNHIHHKFLALGFTHRAAMITILLISAGFAAMNLLLLTHVNINVLLFLDIFIWTVMQLYLSHRIKQVKEASDSKH